MNDRRLAICFAFLTAFAPIACGRSGSAVRGPEAAKLAGEMKCVAVVPFENRTGSPQASQLAGVLLAQAAVAGGHFRVMEPASVATFLELQGIQIAPVTEAAFAANLGRLLGVDGVLMGSIEEFAYREAGGKAISEPAVAFSARLVHVASGEVVWSSQARRVSDSAFAAGRDALARTGWYAAQDLLASFPGRVSRDEALRTCGRWESDQDVDGDGILNMVDRCPYQAESFNGIDDEDGCPEEGLEIGGLTPLVDIRNERLVYRGEIGFVEGTDTLLPHSLLLVKAIARFLEKEKMRAPKVQIEGFSQEPGPKKYQELFAFSRAEAVKKVLGENGVDPGRLVSVGYNSEEFAPFEKGKIVEFLIVE